MIKRFGLSDAQAQAIVDMRLRALTGLEREKIEAEYAELMKKIEEYKAILADKKLLLGVIKKEILVIAEKYGDDRRTKIGFDEFDISMEDLIPRENVVITMTKLGYIKRMSMDTFKSQNRGGKGVKCYKITEKTGDVIGARAVNEDNEVMLITTEGIIIRIACADISILGRITSGVKLINLTEGVTVASVAKVRDKEEKDTNAQQAAVEIKDSAETEESDQPTDQETQDENRGEEE